MEQERKESRSSFDTSLETSKHVYRTDRQQYQTHSSLNYSLDSSSLVQEW